MLTFNYGSTYFSNKVVLTKFISGCRMVWDAILGTSCFYKSKTEEAKRGGKSAILPNWFFRQSITVLSTTPCLLPLPAIPINSSWFFLSKMLGDVFCLRKLSWYIWCKDKMPIPCISIVHLVTSFSHLFKLKTQYYPIWPVATCTAPQLSTTLHSYRWFLFYFLKNRVWKIKLDELDFCSISNYRIFTACAACKIQVQNRPKIKIIQLEFSNSIFKTIEANVL